MTQLDATVDLPAAEAYAAPGVRFEDLVDERTRALIRSRRAGSTRRRGWLVRRALAGADAVGLLVAFAVAVALFGGATAGAPDRVPAWTEWAIFAFSIPCWIVLARLYGLYSSDEERTDHSTVDDLFGVFNMVTVGTWVFVVVTWLSGAADPSVPKVVMFWAGAIVLVTAGRVSARAFCRRTDAYIQNTLIVGAGFVGQRVARKLMQHPEYGVNLLGFVDEHPRERDAHLGDLTVLGSVEQLPAIVHALDVERVIIAFSQHPHEHTLDLIRALNGLDVQVDIVPRLFEVVGPQATLHTAEGLPLLGLPPARLSRSSLFLKRGMDVVLSGLALIVLSPVLAAIALAIKLDSPGPVLFKQERMGRGQRVFRILKFRTMGVDAEARKAELAHLNKHAGGDERMFKIPDDPRVTRVGLFLRRTSLDELPQLVNVLRGEMSLVGPRPIILSEHAYVDGWGSRRLDLKPGITGLWQVLGRDDIPFAEMVELDYRYVTTWSLANDLKLILKTVPALAGRPSG